MTGRKRGTVSLWYGVSEECSVGPAAIRRTVMCFDVNRFYIPTHFYNYWLMIHISKFLCFSSPNLCSSLEHYDYDTCFEYDAHCAGQV